MTALGTMYHYTESGLGGYVMNRAHDLHIARALSLVPSPPPPRRMLPVPVRLSARLGLPREETLAFCQNQLQPDNTLIVLISKPLMLQAY